MLKFGGFNLLGNPNTPSDKLRDLPQGRTRKISRTTSRRCTWTCHVILTPSSSEDAFSISSDTLSDFTTSLRWDLALGRVYDIPSYKMFLCNPINILRQGTLLVSWSWNSKKKSMLYYVRWLNSDLIFTKYQPRDLHQPINLTLYRPVERI